MQNENGSTRFCFSLLHCGLFPIKYSMFNSSKVHLNKATVEEVSALIIKI